MSAYDWAYILLCLHFKYHVVYIWQKDFFVAWNRKKPRDYKRKPWGSCYRVGTSFLTNEWDAIRVLDVGARGGVGDRVVVENIVARASIVDPRRVGPEVAEKTDWKFASGCDSQSKKAKEGQDHFESNSKDENAHPTTGEGRGMSTHLTK